MDNWGKHVWGNEKLNRGFAGDKSG